MHDKHHYSINHYVGGEEEVKCHTCQRFLTKKEQEELVKNFCEGK